MFLLFLRRKILPSLFAFFQKADEKAEKATRVEISMQKYVSFEERGTKNKKRKKRETRQDSSLFYSLFLYLFSERKSTQHTHNNNTNTRALERLKEREMTVSGSSLTSSSSSLLLRVRTSERLRGGGGFLRRRSQLLQQQQQQQQPHHHHHHHHHQSRYRVHLRKKTFASTNNNDNNNSDEATTTTKTQNEYFNCTILSNEPISPDESFRLLTVEIDDDVATVSRMSKQLKMNKEKANGKTTTGRTHTHTTRDSTIDGGYVKNEADFESEWLLRYKFPGQSAQFKLFKEEDWLREDVVDESLGRLTHKLPIAQSPTNLHMARKQSPGASTYTKAEFIVDGKKEEEAHLAKLEPQAKMKISNPRGFGFSNPLFSNEKTLDNAMMSDTIKVPIVIVAKESEGFACAKSLLSSPALLAHASIAPVTVFFLAESTSRLPITVDEIERWKRGGVKIITSVNEDPDGIVDYHSLTIRSALSSSSTGEEDFENSGGAFPRANIVGETRLQHNKCVVCLAGVKGKKAVEWTTLFENAGVRRVNFFSAA